MKNSFFSRLQAVDEESPVPENTGPLGKFPDGNFLGKSIFDNLVDETLLSSVLRGHCCLWKQRQTMANRWGLLPRTPEQNHFRFNLFIASRSLEWLVKAYKIEGFDPGSE